MTYVFFVANILNPVVYVSPLRRSISNEIFVLALNSVGAMMSFSIALNEIT